MRVEVKILDDRLREWGFPSYGSALAAGLDLYACLDHPIFIGGQRPAVLISAGIAIHIDDPEWCAMVLPRSGRGHHDGLVLGNTVGLIDADYQGQVYVSAWNRNDPMGPEIEIRPGERIAQMVFTRIVRPAFEIVDEFSAASDRGEGRLGSTGA